MAGGWKSLRVRSPWDLLVTHKTEACLDHSRVTRATRKGFFMNKFGVGTLFSSSKALKVDVKPQGGEREACLSFHPQ